MNRREQYKLADRARRLRAHNEDGRERIRKKQRAARVRTELQHRYAPLIKLWRSLGGNVRRENRSRATVYAVAWVLGGRRYDREGYTHLHLSEAGVLFQRRGHKGVEVSVDWSMEHAAMVYRQSRNACAVCGDAECLCAVEDKAPLQICYRKPVDSWSKEWRPLCRMSTHTLTVYKENVTCSYCLAAMEEE